MTATETHRAIDAVWRIESARIIAGLTRIVRDVGLAEELAQDALVAALQQWPELGIPDNPGAWLMAAAKNRAIDMFRRNKRLQIKHEELGRDLQTRQETAVPDFAAALDDDIGDDLLRLIFISCHPVLSTEARDFVCRQPPEQAKCQRNPRLRRENRVAGDEYEAQEVVVDIIVERCVEIRHSCLLPGLEFAAKLLVFSLKQLVAAKHVDRAVLRSSHEPRARIVRDARLRPLVERGEESVLRKFLGHTDVAHNPGEAGNDSGRLDSPDRIDGLMCVGSRHGYPSHHLQSARASPRVRRLCGSRASVGARTPMLWEGSLPARVAGELRSRPPNPP